MAFEVLRRHLGELAEEEDDAILRELERRIAAGHITDVLGEYLDLVSRRGGELSPRQARRRREVRNRRHRAGAGPTTTRLLPLPRNDARADDEDLAERPPVRVTARDRATRDVIAGEVLTLAHALALDPYGIEVKVDDVAAYRLAQAGVRGMQDGATVYLHPDLHDPRSLDGRALIAHEMVHLAQRRLPGTAAPERAEAEAATLGHGFARGEHVTAPTIPIGHEVAREEPVSGDDKLYANPIAMKRRVYMGGIEFTPISDVNWVGGLDKQTQGVAAGLKSLVGSKYSVALLNEVMSSLNPEPMGFENGRATQNDAIGTYTFYNPWALGLVRWLQGKKIKLTLTAENLETLQAGVDAANTWPDISELPIPAWFVEGLYWGVMTARVSLLRRYAKALGVFQKNGSVDNEVALEEARFEVWDVVLITTGAMEAIRRDPLLTRDPAYRALWDQPPIDEKTTADVAPAAEDWSPNFEYALFLMHEAMADEKTAGRLHASHDARKKFLKKVAVKYKFADLKTGGDQTVSDSVARATRPPLDSQLSAYPQLEPPFFDTPKGGEREFVMSIGFPDVFEAFRGYVYYWEVIHVADDDIKKLNETADDLSASGETPGTFDVMGSRLKRDIKYGQADMERTIDSLTVQLGDPGLGAISLVSANNMLRMIGTVISTVIEALTKPKYEKTLTFPNEGLYIARCKAAPTPSDDSIIDRAPSVAWLPVWVRPAEQMSKLRVHMDLKSRRGAIDRLAEILEELKDPDLKPEDKQRLLDEQALIDKILDDRGDKQLELEREHLRKAQTADDLDPYQAEQIKKRLSEIDDILALRAKRMKGAKTDGSLEGVVRVTAAFAAEESGQTIRLLLEAFELDAPAGKKQYRVVDSTTRDSRVEDGVGTTREDAIAAAIVTILENSEYGRGYVSLAIPAQDTWDHGGEPYERTERVEKALGKLWMEALENAATVASIAAIAAAPFTGGASLALLIPIGIVGAIPSAYRLIDRADQGTFRWDMATAMDLVNIFTSVITAGVAGAASKAAMQGIKVGKGWMILGLGTDGLGMAVAGYGLIAELEAAGADPDMPDGLRRARVMQILGNHLLQQGIAIGSHLAMRGKQQRAQYESKTDLPEAGMTRAKDDLVQHFREAAGAKGDGIPVFVDADGTRVKGTGVEIHFDEDGYGLPTNLRVIAGPGAGPSELAVHGKRAAAMLTYEGFFGWLRELIDRVSARVKGDKKPKKGSRAWHAQHELDKIADLAHQYAEDLKSGKIDATEYESKMKSLQAQANVHGQAVNEMEDGPGFVAAHDTITEAALAKKYPAPPKDHFYVENGDGTYQLRRQVDSTEPPQKIEWKNGKPVAVPDTTGHGAGVTKTAKAGGGTGADAGQVRSTGAAALGVLPEQLTVIGNAAFDHVSVRRKANGDYEIHFKAGTPAGEIQRAIDRHVQLRARRPDDVKKKPIGKDGKPWTGADEAAYLGRPDAEGGYHWALHDGKLRYVREDIGDVDGETPAKPKKKFDEKSGTLVEDKGGRTENEIRKGASKEEAFEELGGNDPDTEFGAWVEQVEKRLKITKQNLIDSMTEPGGKQHRTVRRSMKDGITEQLVADLNDTTKLKAKYPDLYKGVKAGDAKAMQKADRAASHKEMLEVTKHMGSGDRGSIAEQWYLKNYGSKDAIAHVEFKKDDMPEGVTFTKDRVPDIIDGNKLKDVKHVSSALDPDNRRQLEEFASLIDVGGLTVDGKPLKIESMAVVFTEPIGAVKNAEYISGLIEGNPKISVEIFNSRGERRIVSVADLVTGTFNVAGGKNGLADAIRSFSKP